MRGRLFLLLFFRAAVTAPFLSFIEFRVGFLEWWIRGELSVVARRVVR